MARKMNIPKAKQIQGLRKAIANRKTPKQFLPSLKKRLAKLTVFILCALAAASAKAQAPVSLVPIQQTLATATACTGVAQIFPVNNRNQTQHYATIALSNVNTFLNMKIQGIDNSGNLFTISDVAFGSGVSGASPSVTGTGYFPTVQVVVLCSGGTFTLSYSGGQAISNVNAGTYLSAQVDKPIFAGQNEGTSFTSQFIVPPFGTTNGSLVFQYTTAAIAGSTIAVNCVANGVNNTYTAETYNIANSTAIQTFSVGGFPCGLIQVIYTAGTTGAGSAALDYLFFPPGLTNPVLGSYFHITGTTATAVKATPGLVHTVVIGTPAVGTVTLFDLGIAACTATPSTNVVSVITATATFPAAPEIYDVFFTNGICVKASAAMDLTVGFQ